VYSLFDCIYPILLTFRLYRAVHASKELSAATEAP